MRSSLQNPWFGGEEAQLSAIFRDFLRAPGGHPALVAWHQVANGEPLAILYEVWSVASSVPEQAYAYIDVFMEQYNVLVGVDMAGDASGSELFYHDLTELCTAVDTWLSTGQTTNIQADLAQAASSYYSGIGGMNLGALNVIRGWYELLQVIQDKKRIIRCVATECNKLLVITPDAELLSGTEDGYHNTACREAHLAGAPDDELQLQQLPGNQQLQAAVGPITEGVENGVDATEAS